MGSSPAHTRVGRLCGASAQLLLEAGDLFGERARVVLTRELANVSIPTPVSRLARARVPPFTHDLRAGVKRFPPERAVRVSGRRIPARLR